MSTYVLPAVQVFQDLSQVPSVVANPARAHLAGGHAYLCRYAQSGERELGNLGTYDPVTDHTYTWTASGVGELNCPLGAIIDQDYVKLWLKNALLQYFRSVPATLSGFWIGKKSGARNLIYSKVPAGPNVLGQVACNFATNGAYARDASLFSRDVQVNDIVKVVVDGTTLWTYVKGLVANLAAAGNTPSFDTNNAGTTAGAATATLVTTDLLNNVTLTGNSGWSGVNYGRVADVYTIRVTRGSTNGDFATARISIRTASGEDQWDDIVPNRIGVGTTAIGALNLTATFGRTDTLANSESAENEGIPSEDLVVGQTWRIAVSEPWTQVTAPTVTGSYAYTDSTTYIVECVQGGKWAAGPQVRVTTTNGLDMSGPAVVYGIGAGNAVQLGTRGYSFYFTVGTGLNKGDRWYVIVTGQQTAAVQTIALGHNLPVGTADDTPVEVTFYIPKSLLQLSHVRSYTDGTLAETNWDFSADGTQITINGGAIGYDDGYYDPDSLVHKPLPVASDSGAGYGTLYVEYRAWRSDLAYDVFAISDVSLINTAISGALDPDNPLKWGVFKALENANGTEVKFTAIPNPAEPNDWADMLALLIGREDVYGLVPLTRDRTVQDLYAAHVTAMSSPEQGLWRTAWFSLAGVPEIPVVADYPNATGEVVEGYAHSTTDPASPGNSPCLCTFTGYSGAGTTSTVMECTSNNGHFSNVRVGDIVRTNFQADGTYDSYVVASVVSENEIHLASGPTAVRSQAAQTEVWRTLNLTAEANAIAVNAGAWDNRRIRAVWPDQISSGGTLQDGIFVCAALAGEASGILPHQGMTNLQLLGFDDVSRTKRFNRPQLDTMAAAGVWIVTQDIFSGNIYTRQALTTGSYADLNQREEMLTRNVDSISYRFKDYFKPYIGVTNVTPSMQDLLTFEVNQLIDVLKTEAFSTKLGGQLISGTIVRLSMDVVNRDRFVLILNATVPYAMNVFEIHLVI